MKKDKFAPLRASLLIQGQISYFFIGQGGLVRFSYIKFTKDANHAEKVKSLSSNTFGWGIKLFLLKLFEQGIAKLKQLLSKLKKYGLFYLNIL